MKRQDRISEFSLTELTGYRVEECLGHSMSDYFVKNSDTDSSFVHVIRQLNGIGDF